MWQIADGLIDGGMAGVQRPVVAERTAKAIEHGDAAGVLLGGELQFQGGNDAEPQGSRQIVTEIAALAAGVLTGAVVMQCAEVGEVAAIAAQGHGTSALDLTANGTAMTAQSMRDAGLRNRFYAKCIFAILFVMKLPVN